MTIIAAYYYNEGKRVREIALDERIELGESRSGFCWIALSEPTDDELRAIQTTYNLHPLAIDNAMHPLAELVRKLVRGHFPCISAEMTPYFHDVADHVHRVQSMVDGLLLVLSTVFEASSLLEAQRIGVVTRQLAAWAAILAVPTAIAGIYGMNFKNMPELNTTYGYFVVLGLIAVSSLILFVRFKKSKWL